MADNTVTLATFLTLVREQADVEDLTDRHPDAELVRFINLAWRLLRTKVSNAGFSYFITPTTVTNTLPTSPPYDGAQYLEVNYPTGATGVYGLDVRYGGDWTPLEPVSFGARRDFAGSGDVPHRYCVRTVPTESAATLTAGKIMLFPASSGGEEYIVWYLPVWTDIAAANTTYLFYGHDAWFDWAIQDVVRRIAQKDDDAQNTLGEALRRQAELWEDIRRSALNMNLAEPISVRRRRPRGNVARRR